MNEPFPERQLLAVGRRSTRERHSSIHELQRQVGTLWFSAAETATLHYIWGARLGRESLQATLIRWFNDHPDDVDAFLANYLGGTWSMETGEPVRPTFDRGKYDRVAQVVDPELTANNPRNRYVIHEPQRYQGQDVPIGLALANQFLFVHRHTTPSAAPAAEAEVEK